MHSTWQEVDFFNISPINNFGQFLKQLHVRTLDLFPKFGSLFLKLLISKNANICATGPLHLHYAFHVAGSRFLEHFVHQQFWSIFEKKLHVRTLDFFPKFGSFFLKLLISNNATFNLQKCKYSLYGDYTCEFVPSDCASL